MAEPNGGGDSLFLPDWLVDLNSEMRRRGGVAASGIVALAVLLTDPRAFFEEYLLDTEFLAEFLREFFVETIVGWILSGIVALFEELVEAARLMGDSAYQGFVVPWIEVAAALEAVVESWVGWQTAVVVSAAAELGLAGPFVSIMVIGMVLIVNALVLQLVWSVANDYLPLQLVSEPIRGALATARETVSETTARLFPPYGGDENDA